MLDTQENAILFINSLKDIWTSSHKTIIDNKQYKWGIITGKYNNEEYVVIAIPENNKIRLYLKSLDKRSAK